MERHEGTPVGNGRASWFSMGGCGAFIVAVLLLLLVVLYLMADHDML